MSETKFTKGPWYVDDYGDVQANGEDVARIATCGEQSGADAHLIAAAPEMYQALLALIPDAEENHHGGPDTAARLNAAHAALAKARGELP